MSDDEFVDPELLELLTDRQDGGSPGFYHLDNLPTLEPGKLRLEIRLLDQNAPGFTDDESWDPVLAVSELAGFVLYRENKKLSELRLTREALFPH